MWSLISNYLFSLWSILTELAPWLFLGMAIAGLLKLFLPADFVSRHLGGRRLSSIFKTVAIGVPLPLCSCGVIPTALGLKKSGASDGATVGFLISTPQTGLDSVMVSASFFGWPFALFKVAAALVTGVVGGLVTHGLEGRPSASAPAPPPTPGPAASPARLSFTQGLKVFYSYTVEELLGGIYRYLAAGILIAALIAVVFPAQSLAHIPALQGPLGMLLMLLISLPLYVCATGSVPIAASLIAAGLPLGSALVFLMAGPASNAATVGAVYRTLGWKNLAVYLATIVLGSMVFGWIFQTWLGGNSSGWILGLHHHHTASPVWQVVSALAAAALAALIARWSWLDATAWLGRRSRRAQEERTSLPVAGMSCQSCARRVESALSKLPNVKNVSVDLEHGCALVWGRDLEREQLARAVQEAGYQVPDSGRRQP
ncbi:MAG: permease [candidate division FCPU426 bacterium]